jgi:hypothetical protein
MQRECQDGTPYARQEPPLSFSPPASFGFSAPRLSDVSQAASRLQSPTGRYLLQYVPPSLPSKPICTASMADEGRASVTLVLQVCTVRRRNMDYSNSSSSSIVSIYSHFRLRLIITGASINLIRVPRRQPCEQCEPWKTDLRWPMGTHGTVDKVQGERGKRKCDSRLHPARGRS